ncbi:MULTISPECIES: NAD-dependent epimerase/dehydratase family protein [unclassified Ruegeria]|uniref:NAD-dependent epimerase/dehydratase family protein n=1 Tax=unclassified Ruegeria TaxID=2625375 RepID=UPI001489821D|nr:MULTISPECIES: NAD-dependent epimerase/dehydratase family protein [unclassified Ruegeria]NOD34410.1 NAD-dependent epimerase/dehydratase family protein [Ruegeria sp. HKCCD7296]NOE34241.1 NAD-dependent epimerase/dehydratase family protein [Ruegeria sp. HKCCD7318]NOE40366.1 NAD-dependent epimerase/dehydratase family protein [Ruegeria sp. HKCCD7319]
MKRVLITGSAGFIGFHLAKLLLSEGFQVHGYDGMTDYYDVTLKQRRHQILLQTPGFTATEDRLENYDRLVQVAEEFHPDVIVHLAAQAGVRHSLEYPRSYIESNVVGTFNVMEIARQHEVGHLLMASTSSIYGANEEMPFTETEKADTQLTIYSATKKANEAMGHSYAHLWNLPTTMFRFFTVYGTWGRPDLAYFKFVAAILEGRPIDIYNHGDMYRDFTHVEDLVRGIRLLIDVPPVRPASREDIEDGDSLSTVAPYRIVNIGNGDKVRLMDFIEAIEEAVGQTAIKNFMPMQMGDVHATWADNRLLQRLTNYRPQTDLKDGIAQFVSWYRDYYGK